jgi:hypothetical protein
VPLPGTLPVTKATSTGHEPPASPSGPGSRARHEPTQETFAKKTTSEPFVVQRRVLGRAAPAHDDSVVIFRIDRSIAASMRSSICCRAPSATMSRNLANERAEASSRAPKRRRLVPRGAPLLEQARGIAGHRMERGRPADRPCARASHALIERQGIGKRAHLRARLVDRDVPHVRTHG